MKISRPNTALILFLSFLFVILVESAKRFLFREIIIWEFQFITLAMFFVIVPALILRFQKYISFLEFSNKKMKAEIQKMDLSSVTLNSISGILDKSFLEIYIIDARSLNYLDANDRALNQLGYTREEIKSLTPLEIEEQSCDSLFVEQSLILRRNPNSTVVYEAYFKTSSGNRYPVQVHLYLYDHENKTAFVALTRNISKSHEQRDLIKDLEEKIGLASQAVKSYFWRWEIVRDKFNVSEEFELMTGIKGSSFGNTYNAYLDIIHPDDRPIVSQAIEGAIGDSNVRLSIEYRIQLPGGINKWVRGRGRVYRDESGKPLRLLCVVQDISEKKDLESEITILRERLNKQSQSSLQE